MAEVTLSIIIPIYNAEKYVEQCIQSVLQETDCRVEILLIDDGSTDRSGVIAQQIVRQDERVKYIFQSNQGVSAARNRGLEVAIGKWILFIDADDTIEDNAIQRIYEISKKVGSENCIIFGCDTKEEYFAWKLPKNAKEKLLMEACGAIPNATYGANFTSVWGKLYRSSFLRQKKILFDTDIVMGEDFLFNCDVLVNLSEIVFSNFRYYHYRLNNTSATHRKNKSIADGDEKFQRRLLNIATNNNYKWLEKDGCACSVLNGIIISFQAYFSRFCILEYSSYRKELGLFLKKDIYKKALFGYEEYINNYPIRYRFILFCFKHKMYSMPFIAKKLKFHMKKNSVQDKNEKYI